MSYVSLFVTFYFIFDFSCIKGYEIDCTHLRLGQFICPDPAYDQIDPLTQQFYGCTRENKAKVLCRAADGIVCAETKNSTFRKELPCKWTNGYSFETALLLSIFLGMFGLDRFYLGYPGIGLLKLCTMGFMFIGQLIDVILIATQIVGPADGSYYVIPYYGAGIEIIRSDNTTYRLPQNNCYSQSLLVLRDTSGRKEISVVLLTIFSIEFSTTNLEPAIEKLIEEEQPQYSY